MRSLAGILFVEDEAGIQQKLVGNIRWMDYGFDRVYAADNGIEALRVLERYAVDVMVTDVQMPKMNGLELLKTCKRRGYSVKTVVISGYAEFEYARESLELNAADYLLKPFASQKLLGVVLRLHQEKTREHADKLELCALREQLDKNLPRLQDKFFSDIIHEQIIVSDLQSELEFLGLSALKSKPCQAAVVEISPGRMALEDVSRQCQLKHPIYQEVNGFLADWRQPHWILSSQLNQLSVLIFEPGPEAVDRLEGLIDHLQKETHQGVTVGLGRSYPALTHLADSYREACMAAGYRYLYGSGRLFSFAEVQAVERTDYNYFYDLHQHVIFDDLRRGAFSALRKDLNQLIAEFRRAELGPEFLQIIVGNLLLLTSMTLTELGYDARGILGLNLPPVLAVQRVETLDDLEERLWEMFAHIQTHVEQRQTSLNEKVIEEIRRYLDQHFATEISLSAIAAQYKLSPSYLSMLFTERTGQNFSDYLTTRRIQKAKELLKHTDMKIYEISAAVGYHDSFYFSNCFKKIVGRTPSDYRAGADETDF